MNVKNTKYTRRMVNMGGRHGGGITKVINSYGGEDHFNKIAFKGGISKISPWLA